MWKNFDDLEGNLTLDELYLLVSTAREKENDRLVFMARINGIDMQTSEEIRQQQRFDEVKIKALAETRGVSVEQVSLAGQFDFVDE